MKEADRRAIGEKMDRKTIEELREQVGCGAVLESAGYAIDAKESTRKAVKYRRGGEIIIVTHEGRGWFDPLSDDKGDVFSLVAVIHRLEFRECVQHVAGLVGYELSGPQWTGPSKDVSPSISLPERWMRRKSPSIGSAAWRYLTEARMLQETVVLEAVRQDLLREGPHGSMWAAHTDEAGTIRGWEERGPEWRGFASGGAKILFRIGVREPRRICVTEAAIDAMSLAAMEGVREDTLYLSTGGGWSPGATAALRDLACRPDILLVAATDANAQGDAYAHRLHAIASEMSCAWQRLRPSAEDWNEALRLGGVEERKGTETIGVLPQAYRPHQGKLRPAEPPLTRPTTMSAVREG